MMDKNIKILMLTNKENNQANKQILESSLITPGLQYSRLTPLKPWAEIWKIIL